MRLLLPLLLFPLLTIQAQAQTGAAQPTTPPAAAPAAGPAARPHAAAPHHRVTWQEHFAEANTTHDGHLTLQQAKDGYRTLVRHFAEIDAGKKGYVTVDDITAWHKLQRAMRRPSHDQSSDTLRPRPAMQHGMSEPQQIHTSTETKVAPMAPTGATPANGSAATAQTGHGT
jgi:hypothetical protein